MIDVFPFIFLSLSLFCFDKSTDDVDDNDDDDDEYYYYYYYYCRGGGALSTKSGYRWPARVNNGSPSAFQKVKKDTLNLTI